MVMELSMLRYLKTVTPYEPCPLDVTKMSPECHLHAEQMGVYLYYRIVPKKSRRNCVAAFYYPRCPIYEYSRR